MIFIKYTVGKKRVYVLWSAVKTAVICNHSNLVKPLGIAITVPAKTSRFSGVMKPRAVCAREQVVQASSCNHVKTV